MDINKATISDADAHRRRLLIAGTAGMGAIGLVGVTVPFVESMEPSEAAKAAGAPVEADISTLGLGKLITVGWRGRPVWVLHRTPEMIDQLGKHNNLLVDPASQQSEQPPYAKNATRSIKPEYLILTGVCTHLGCTPVFRPEPGAADLGPEWPGGFYCPCHGSRFDLAGRVFKNVPAPLNLEVPRHLYLSNTRLLIGDDKGKS